ncbi:hypothetical protein MIND_00400100 [Mycena indigotica]|uniref:Uncharacterized protein n=1 Tax=Mycena indigotica TaxID=2126181 RepID=A0A8H6WA13_9AGAR|nr:uncharacterized protein MIND_00400100 [Mycena indigotica]KAF7310262.1 hypothetical protein MIND_00400100 [Mycena indigotica]
MAAKSDVSFSFGVNNAYIMRAGRHFAGSDDPPLPTELLRILTDKSHPQYHARMLDVALPLDDAGYYMLSWEATTGKSWLERDAMGSAYPRLHSFMRFGTTYNTAFGPDRSFFSASPAGYAAQNLPPGLETGITESAATRHPVCVALGREGTYAVVYSNGSYAWQLALGGDSGSGKTLYPELEKMFEKDAQGESEAQRRKGLKYIALDPNSTTQFFALFNDDSVWWDLPQAWFKDIEAALSGWRATRTSTPGPAADGATKSRKWHDLHAEDVSEFVEGFKEGVEMVSNVLSIAGQMNGSG